MRKFVELLKRDYKLDGISLKNKEIPEFIIYGGKDNFRLNKLWTIKGFANQAFLISYRTKYDVEVSGTGGMSYLTDQSSENHMSIILKSPITIPDLLIRPRTVTDFISDPLFKNDTKLQGELRFNLKYILESNSNPNNVPFLKNLDFLDKINGQKHLWIETKDSHFTWHFQNGLKLNNLKAILEIAEYIDQKICV